MPVPSETRCSCWGTPGRNSAARSCGRPCTGSPAASRRAWISRPSAGWSITSSPGRSAGCSAPRTIARRAGWASRSPKWRWAARTTRRASAWTSISPPTAWDLRLSSCCSASRRGEPSSHAPPTAPPRWRRWRRSWACRPSASVRWACGVASCGLGCATHSSRTPSTGCARYISRRSPNAWETDGRMCGIIGVTGVPDAARVAYLGLYSLQHRGQESAGMVAVDGEGVARSHRGMGLVADIFGEPALAGLQGDVAIGHTRYSTAGSSVLANAQPILAGYREGPLALAHNGNLTNAGSLRSDLVAKGSIFQTSSDSEVLIHLIARSEAREPEDQLLDALERVEGAYSLVITVGRTLYAIVDPRGFRPLWLGKLGDGYVVASETCALDLIGATAVREIQPGEFLRIQGSPPELDRLPALVPKPHRRCIFALVYFSRPDSTIFGRSVDRVRRALGRELAREHPAA